MRIFPGSEAPSLHPLLIQLPPCVCRLEHLRGKHVGRGPLPTPSSFDVANAWGFGMGSGMDPRAVRRPRIAGSPHACSVAGNRVPERARRPAACLVAGQATRGVPELLVAGLRVLPAVRASRAQRVRTPETTRDLYLVVHFPQRSSHSSRLFLSLFISSSHAARGVPHPPRYRRPLATSSRCGTRGCPKCLPSSR